MNEGLEFDIVFFERGNLFFHLRHVRYQGLLALKDAEESFAWDKIIGWLIRFWDWDRVVDGGMCCDMCLMLRFLI